MNMTLVIVLLVAVGVSSAPNSHQPLLYNISEELPANSLVGDVRTDFARLTSASVDTNHRYSLRRPSKYFRMDGGVMRTAVVLDRELVCPSRQLVCTLNVDVVLRGHQLVTIIKVIVSIVDVNDHAPVFSGLSTVDIVLPVDAAVGALFPLPAADDGDAGQLGVVAYRLDGKFPRELFELSVTDLIDGSHDVRLRLTAPLDRRHAAVYAMKLVAVDGGRQPRSGSVNITVTVERLVTPIVEFEPAVYTARISENSPVRHPIVHVRARLSLPDVRNSQSGVNSDIVYSMGSGQTSAFAIDSRTGLVYLNDTVDYEHDRSFRMTVIAISSAETIPSSSATASLIVDVSDVNDNSPDVTLNALTQSGRPQVSEAVAEGTFVAHVAVADADSFGVNSRTSCLVSGPPSSLPPLFRLHQLVAGSRPEYKLVTAVGKDYFDRETSDVHHVTISCHDFGTPSLTSSVDVAIDVIDVNDNSPQFSNDTYIAWLPVGLSSSNRKLIQLVATDSDIGRNAELHYSLQPVAPTDICCVTINSSTGLLSADSAAASREYQTGTELRFVAEVSDSGEPVRSSTATVVIHVISDDEVPLLPRFSNASYVLAADCDVPVGSRIGHVFASAADPRDQVMLRFQPPTADFRIDSSTGAVIVVSYGLLTETGDAASSVVRTTVVAVASRPNAPTATTSASVTIHVRCGLPRFIFPNPTNSTVSLANDEAVEGAVVMLPDVKARSGSALRFTLVDSLDAMFNMDPLTGLVRLAKTPQTVSSSPVVYRLTLKVSDDTGATDVGELLVTVEPAREAAATALVGLMSTERAVIIVGMACGAGGLLTAVLAVLLVSICVRRRRAKRSNNYNCR